MSNKRLTAELILSTIDKATAPLKKVMGGSSQTAKALKEAKDQLAGLQRQQRDISSFRKLEAATRNSGDALRDQQQKTAALAREMKQTASPSKRLQREFDKARATARQLQRAHQGNQYQLQQLSTQLRANGINTDRLDRHQNSLQRQMRQANEAIDKQKKKLFELAAQQQRVNKIQERAAKTRMKLAGYSTAAFGSGMLAMHGIGGMMAPVMQAQAGGSLIAARQGQGSSISGDYANIINTIKASGSMADIAEIANALDGAAAAFGALGDTSAEELQRITRHALNLSSAFSTDTAQSIQMAQIMLKNGLAHSADEAFDLITRGMQSVTAEMRGELPDILHEYSTHFRGMGFSGQEAMNLLVQMAEQGRFALDKTGDAIKEFSIRGSDLSKSSTEAYELIGLDAQEMASAIASGGVEAQRALRATVKGLRELTDPAERANAAIALFGTPMEDLAVDQIPGFLDALSGTKDVLDKTLGAADRLGNTLRNDLQGDLGKLSGAWSGLKSQLFGGESGALRGITQQLTGMVQRVTQWAKANPELTATIVRVIAVAAALVTILGALGLAASSVMFGFAGLMKLAPILGIFKAFGPVLLSLGKVALPLVAGGIKAISAALISNPIGLAVAAIAGAAWLIYKNWEPIKRFFANIWAEVKTAFSGGIGGVTKLLLNWSPIGLIYKAIRAGLSKLGIDLPAQFSDFGAHMIDGIIGGIKGKLKALKDTVTGAASAASNWFKEKLGIHSPSRVFASHGSDVMAGLAQGLGDQQQVLRPVNDVSKRLKQAGAGIALGTAAMGAAAGQIAIDSRAPLSAAATAGGTASHIEIHVHAAPGMDEQALARLVAQELERAQAAKAARRRSNLSDED